MKNNNTIGCCDDFKRAQGYGTDNEGYGSLLSQYNGEWNIGCGLSSITVCPWCRTDLNELLPKGSNNEV